MTDRIDTAALRRAREETTQGEWRWQADSFAGLYADKQWLLEYGYSDDGIHSANPADGDFIALAHREWPALLDRIDALEAEVERLRGALQPFAKSGELLVKAGDSGRFWAYRPAGGDEYGIAGTHLLEARTALGDPS